MLSFSIHRSDFHFGKSQRKPTGVQVLPVKPHHTVWDRRYVFVAAVVVVEAVQVGAITETALVPPATSIYQCTRQLPVIIVVLVSSAELALSVMFQ